MQDHLSPCSESAVDRSRGIAFLASVHQVAEPIPAERGVPSRPCRHPAAAFALRPPYGDALIEGTPCLALPLSCGLWPPDGGEPEPLPPSPARLFPGRSPPSGPRGADGVPPKAPSSSDVDRCSNSLAPQSNVAATSFSAASSNRRCAATKARTACRASGRIADNVHSLSVERKRAALVGCAEI